MAVLDLEQKFTFYASYHNTPVNIAIHLACIWPILATAVVVLQHTPDLVDAGPDFLGGHVRINLALVLSLVYIHT